MAVHMSVIPKGSHQGWILMWPHDDYQGDPIGQIRYHRWALLDPTAPISASNPENYCMPLPADKGDLFCAGHAWTANGDLLVVGGTGKREGNGWGGSTLAYLWKPPGGSIGNGGKWEPVPDLDQPRWYPSIVALGTHGTEDRMLVGGGTHFITHVNSYQVWRPSGGLGGSWEQNPVTLTNHFPGPTTGFSFELGDYPRLHLMSGPQDLASVLITGMRKGTDRVGHYGNPGIWHGDANWLQAHDRIYGTSVILPIAPGGILKDWVINMGGAEWNDQATPPGFEMKKTVEIANGGTGGTWPWGTATPMAHKRWLTNSVLMPDSTVIVFGGEKQEGNKITCSEVPAYVPERYDLQTPQQPWTSLTPDTIIRNYHSTAVLLPSGKVLTGGGEYRKNLPEMDCQNPNPMANPEPFEDYRVFVPGYLNCGKTRPVITNPPAVGSAITCNQGGVCPVSYQNLPFPLTIAKVVLLRPGSVTHHADTNQRCVELEFTIDLPIPGGSSALVSATIPPANSGLLPRGYYMLFLVTNERVPSHAVWIKVE